MAKKTIIVCDICESTDRVTAWEVKEVETGKKAKAELCAKHADPLAVIVSPEDQAPSAPSARRRRGGNRVVSLEEIEAQKATQGAS